MKNQYQQVLIQKLMYHDNDQIHLIPFSLIIL